MNKMIGILSFVVVVGNTLPEVSWADKHVFVQSEEKRPSLMFAERNDFVGPVQRNEGLSLRAGKTPWDGFSLAHTDTHHSLGRDQHHPALHRNFHAPDGVALMFSWPFESLSTFRTNTQPIPGTTTFNYDNEATDVHAR